MADVTPEIGHLEEEPVFHKMFVDREQPPRWRFAPCCCRCKHWLLGRCEKYYVWPDQFWLCDSFERHGLGTVAAGCSVTEDREKSDG